MKIKQRLLSYGLCLAFASFTSTQLNAAGFETDLTSTSGLANSYAGSATGSHDISDSYFNPAILTSAKSTTMIASLSYLRLNIDADNVSSKTSGGTAVSNNRTGDAGVDSLIPALYFSTPINNKTVFGLAITSPYGLATKYDKGWGGRYQAVDSQVTTINFNPSLAYKVNDDLSVGVGLVAQYMSATLTSMFDYGGVYGSGTGTADKLAKYKGSDWGYGYNFGFDYKLNKQTKIGLGYRSKIDNKLEGKASIDALAYSNFNSSLATPESIDAGISYQANHDNEIVADVLWTRWSRLKTLGLHADNSTLSNTVNFNWHDSFRYSLGLNHKANDKLMVRLGTAYEKDAVSNGDRTPAIPSGNRIWLSGGFGYKVAKGTTIDATYMHQFYRQTQVDLAATSTAPGLRASYKAHVDVISIALKKEF